MIWGSNEASLLGELQAALGLENYSIILCEYRNRWRMKHHGRSKENAPERVH